MVVGLRMTNLGPSTNPDEETTVLWLGEWLSVRLFFVGLVVLSFLFSHFAIPVNAISMMQGLKLCLSHFAIPVNAISMTQGLKLCQSELGHYRYWPCLCRFHHPLPSMSSAQMPVDMERLVCRWMISFTSCIHNS